MQKCATFVEVEHFAKKNIFLLQSSSIEPKTSTVKFARSPCTDPPGAFKIRGSTDYAQSADLMNCFGEHIAQFQEGLTLGLPKWSSAESHRL